MERLQKIIAASGYASRRKAEELITSGKVYVNGEKITELGVKVKPSDEVLVNGIHLKKEEKVYYLINKPRRVISSVKDEHNRKTVVDLVDGASRIYPVGRLDYDTTGLLLLTNDGDFANILMHPSNNVEKTYIAKIKGIIKGEDINKIKDGVVIDGVKTGKSKVKLKKYDPELNTSIVSITINEGRNHQVKKMFLSVGHEVLKLKREKEAFFDLNDLKTGEYRHLTKKEVHKVFSLQKITSEKNKGN